MNDAVAWHSRNAVQFDGNYARQRAFDERRKIWFDILDRFGGPDHFVVDVGCGSGVFSLYAAQRNATVLGVDGSREMIDLCERRRKETSQNNVTFTQTDIATLTDVVRARPNLIICSSVLEYVTDFERVLQTFSSLIAPGGIVAISMPNPASLFRRIEPIVYKLTGRPKYFGFVRNIVSVNRMAQLLSQAGLEPIESRYFAGMRGLASFFRPMGLSKYSDNLYVVVARRAAK